MKFKIFTMLVTLGVLSVTPMIYMGKFDPMSLINSAFNTARTETDAFASKLPDSVTDVVGEHVANKTVQVYKWRDANGVMQFSSTPPEGNQAERVILNPNANLMQAVKIEKKEEPNPVQQAQVKIPTPYSVKSMKKVMDDAKGVEDMLQQRFEEQQKVLNNI